MTAVREIVRDALQHLGVIDARQPIQAVDMQDAIRALNLMMRAWETEGDALGWQDVDAPDDTLPAPPEAEEAIGYSLAVRLRARFQVALEPDVLAAAQAGRALISAQIQANSFERTEYPDLPVGVGSRQGSWRDGYFK